jgi:hypothetical protein
MPRLTDRAHLIPGGCPRCGRTGERVRPLPRLRVHRPARPAGLLLRQLLPQLVAALDVVPRSDLQDVLAEVRRAQERLNDSSQAWQAAEQNAPRAGRLAAELEGARSRIQSLERTVKALMAEPARERREALLAG